MRSPLVPVRVPSYGVGFNTSGAGEGTQVLVPEESWDLRSSADPHLCITCVNIQADIDDQRYTAELGCHCEMCLSLTML